MIESCANLITSFLKVFGTTNCVIVCLSYPTYVLYNKPASSTKCSPFSCLSSFIQLLPNLINSHLLFCNFTNSTLDSIDSISLATFKGFFTLSLLAVICLVVTAYVSCNCPSVKISCTHSIFPMIKSYTGFRIPTASSLPLKNFRFNIHIGYWCPPHCSINQCTYCFRSR